MIVIWQYNIWHSFISQRGVIDPQVSTWGGLSVLFNVQLCK